MEKAPKYVVLTNTLVGWENVWTVTNSDGTEVPMEFLTKEEAQKEIDEVVEETGYNPEDYRIVEKNP